MKLRQQTVLTRTAVESYNGDFKKLVNSYCDYMSFEQGIPGLKWKFVDMQEDLEHDCYVLIYEANITEQQYMWHKLGGTWQ
jgi:hypothetical protein